MENNMYIAFTDLSDSHTKYLDELFRHIDIVAETAYKVAQERRLQFISGGGYSYLAALRNPSINKMEMNLKDKVRSLENTIGYTDNVVRDVVKELVPESASALPSVSYRSLVRYVHRCVRYGFSIRLDKMGIFSSEKSGDHMVSIKIMVIADKPYLYINGMSIPIDILPSEIPNFNFIGIVRREKKYQVFVSDREKKYDNHSLVSIDSHQHYPVVGTDFLFSGLRTLIDNHVALRHSTYNALRQNCNIRFDTESQDMMVDMPMLVHLMTVCDRNMNATDIRYLLDEVVLAQRMSQEERLDVLNARSVTFSIYGNDGIYITESFAVITFPNGMVMPILFHGEIEYEKASSLTLFDKNGTIFVGFNSEK